MSSELFELDVAVHVDGYCWIDAVAETSPDAQPEPCLTPCVPFGEERHYDPLTDETGLFRQFAELDTSEKAILSFANQYGPMGKWISTVPPGWRRTDWQSRRLGERLQDWCESIAYMRLAVSLWDKVRGDDQEGLSRHITWPSKDQLVFDSHPDLPVGQDAPWLSWRGIGKDELELNCDHGDVVRPVRRIIAICIQENLGKNASVSVRSPADCPEEMQVCVRMMGLGDAVWFQFAQAVTGNRDYRRCRTCGKWYELHPDTARTNRRFCSDACRSKAYRHRKAEARRLFADGAPIEEIARRFDTKPTTVHAWISRGL